jgi:hypothetical protein
MRSGSIRPPRLSFRFTRPTSAFAKEEQRDFGRDALLALNFCRIHRTLSVSRAMDAGVTDRLWEIGDIVGVLQAFESRTAASSS